MFWSVIICCNFMTKTDAKSPPRYGFVSKDSLASGLVDMQVARCFEEQVILKPNPTGTINGGAPIFLWVWPKAGTMIMDGFLDEERKELNRLWNGTYKVCISMDNGDFPGWISSSMWFTAHIQGIWPFAKTKMFSNLSLLAKINTNQRSLKVLEIHGKNLIDDELWFNHYRPIIERL